MINKYGYRMTGLDTVARETKVLSENTASKGLYLQVSYNLKEDELYFNEHCSLGFNSFTKYDDDDIITVDYLSSPITQQQLADLVNKAIAEHSLNSEMCL